MPGDVDLDRVPEVLVVADFPAIRTDRQDPFEVALKSSRQSMSIETAKKRSSSSEAVVTASRGGSLAPSSMVYVALTSPLGKVTEWHE
jgi:hypothetical protein